MRSRVAKFTYIETRRCECEIQCTRPRHYYLRASNNPIHRWTCSLPSTTGHRSRWTDRRTDRSSSGYADCAGGNNPCVPPYPAMLRPAATRIVRRPRNQTTQLTSRSISIVGRLIRRAGLCCQERCLRFGLNESNERDVPESICACAAAPCCCCSARAPRAPGHHTVQTNRIFHVDLRPRGWGICSPHPLIGHACSPRPPHGSNELNFSY